MSQSQIIPTVFDQAEQRAPNHPLCLQCKTRPIYSSIFYCEPCSLEIGREIRNVKKRVGFSSYDLHYDNSP